MLKRFVKILGGDPNKREIVKSSPLVDQINALEDEYQNLTDEALSAKTVEFRTRLADELEGIEDPKERAKVEKDVLEDILPDAFAAVREASKRTIGLRHYDVQLIGGSTLHQGKIAEMRTGEGKTLVATLPLYLNALTGKGVHLVTVNDYLARRDARWMAPIFNLLGMSVGVLQMAARTENGKKAFIVDLERSSPHEDQHQLRMAPRQEAYLADITYGTNSEFGFDYLRDNMTMRMEERVQHGHFYAIVDEVDNVLIDEARTPLIISGPAQDEAEWYIRMAQVVKGLRPEDYEINEKDHTVTLTELGEIHVEDLLGMPLRDPDRPEDVTFEQARLLGYLEQALRAQFLFRRNKDYLVQAGKVIIVDEFTGRLMPGRRWSDGLHQAVEAKESVRVQSESVTYATITIQNYFRMYDKLSGMTGTALTEAEEFSKIYKLDVLSIPTNLEYQAMRPETGLVEQEDRDEKGNKFRYYLLKNDPQRTPIFWKRKDYPDIIYRTEEAKLRAIVKEILHYHVLGRPMLVGTTSVELSERLSARLKAEPLRRRAQVMLLRQFWLDKNNREEDGRQIQELLFLDKPLPDLDISEMRKMARDLDVSFNPEDPNNLEKLLGLLNLTHADRTRLVADLSAGIPHQVLNARKHTEESQIIAEAGAFGAVTIATNMAGRGVDIKLGGELAEEILAAVNRVLRRAGYDNPYEMTMEERRQVLLDLPPADYGIYEAEITFFFQHMEDMERVRKLGGLHVIGSERHEARRIDNQLRGRSARQGDPGSSRFYLSMEDELMHLFGGQQADSLMQRLKIDDAVPLEVGVVSRIVEQAQTRVEGSNFDVRKHLLEYDDVLNTQRSKIYTQRDRIFTKDDLSEDVTEMLGVEVNRRVPEALKDEEGPWKLLAWLEQIQPPLVFGRFIYPSYSLKLLADHLFGDHQSAAVDQSMMVQDTVTVQNSGLDNQTVLDGLLKIAEDSLKAEEEHLLHTVNTLLDQTQDRLESQIKDRKEALDTFFEGLSLEDETDTRRPVDLMNELSNTVRLPIKLSPEQQRALKNNPRQVKEEVQSQVEASLVGQAVSRLVGSVERRLEESLELNFGQLPAGDWDTLADLILGSLEAVFNRRRGRLLGNQGHIAKDLENALARLEGSLNQRDVLQLLLMLPQGTRAMFDKRTHRRVLQRTTRLTYTFLVARMLENQEPEKVAEEVLNHLEEAQTIIRQAWGQVEFSRAANVRMAELSDISQRGLQVALGEERCSRLANLPLQAATPEDRGLIIHELGRQALTEIYRQLMLSVVTELWVDYLTQMESLRISIGLEAYAQRDPLVQYKSRAFGLFQELLSNMRQGVVTRMFTYRPREIGSLQTSTDTKRSETEQTGPNGVEPGSDSYGSEQRVRQIQSEENPDELAEVETDPARNAAPDAVGTAPGVAPTTMSRASIPDSEDKRDLSISQKRRRRRH